VQSYGLAAHAVENLLVSVVAQEQRSRVVLVTQVEETWQSERLPAKIALWLFNGRSVDRAGGCAATDAPLIASLPTGAPSGLDLDPSIAPKGRFALVPFSLRDALPPTATPHADGSGMTTPNSLAASRRIVPMEPYM